MPCFTVHVGGVRAIVSVAKTPNKKCRWCAANGKPNSRTADLLCDFPTGPGKTCDVPICARHATEVGPNRHHCPDHAGKTLSQLTLEGL